MSSEKVNSNQTFPELYISNLTRYPQSSRFTWKSLNRFCHQSPLTYLEIQPQLPGGKTPRAGRTIDFSCLPVKLASQHLMEVRAAHITEPVWSDVPNGGRRTESSNTKNQCKDDRTGGERLDRWEKLRSLTNEGKTWQRSRLILTSCSCYLREKPKNMMLRYHQKRWEGVWGKPVFAAWRVIC